MRQLIVFQSSKKSSLCVLTKKQSTPKPQPSPLYNPLTSYSYCSRAKIERQKYRNIKIIGKARDKACIKSITYFLDNANIGDRQYYNKILSSSKPSKAKYFKYSIYLYTLTSKILVLKFNKLFIIIKSNLKFKVYIYSILQDLITNIILQLKLL